MILPGETINLVGGDAELAERLRRILPDTRITTHFPPMGMIENPAAMAAAVDFMRANAASYHLLCCGSPQQEVVAYRAKLDGSISGTALCIGAAVEFLVERKQRAPLVMRRMGLEWLHRLVSEPRRLWRRYLIRSPKVLPIILGWAFMPHLRKK
jgi:exopolysaccharide biosynthesis WecB/TagA/CpsF family protein